MRPSTILSGVLTTAVVASTVLLGAGSAAAADFTLDLPAGQACPGFDLRVEGTVGKRHVREFFDADGNIVRTITAGTGSALTFTNLSTYASLSLRSNGAVERTVLHADGTKTTTSTGHTVLILFPTDVPAGPTTTLIVGRTVYDVDANGVFTVQSVSGRTQDICASLSS
ncbi:MAG: hypothetical protein ACXWXO_18795 [Nocardioides sp.]